MKCINLWRPFQLKQIAKYPLIFPPKTIKQTCRGYLEKISQKFGVNHHIIMESSNVELSSSYVEMGLEISFASVIREIPSLTIRKVEFLSMDHLFKPGNISVVMRKEKIWFHTRATLSRFYLKKRLQAGLYKDVLIKQVFALWEFANHRRTNCWLFHANYF